MSDIDPASYENLLFGALIWSEAFYTYELLYNTHS